MARKLYISADLRRVGPTNQTLNIILNANDNLDEVLVLTLFAEPEKTMMQDYLDKGIKVESLNLERGKFFFVCKALYDYLKHNSFDFVHSNGVKPDICLYFVSKLLEFKHVITLRNIPMEDAPTRMNKWVGLIIGKIHTYVIKHSKCVVACSKTVCEVMTSKYGCKDIHVIQNGVDVEKFVTLDKIKCRQKIGIPRDAKVCISTGSFIPRKHNDLLIKAFLEINVPNSILIMLGEGGMLNDCKAKYSNFANVRFEGLVSNVREYLSASDVFVSASESEGLPNAVLEAVACNLPVVLSDISQHREILDALPNCGVLFPLNNVSSMSDRINVMFNSLNRYFDVSKQLLNSPFTMERMGAHYKSYYECMQGLGV